MSEQSEIAHFKSTSLRYHFPKQFSNEVIFIAAWIDASVHSLPCPINSFPQSLTNEIVRYLSSRGISEQQIAEAFSKTRNGFAPPIIVHLSRVLHEQYKGQTMRSITAQEFEQGRKRALEDLKRRHWLANGNTVEQKRIEDLAIDLILGHGRAIAARSQLNANQQMMLNSIRMWRNQVTYPRNVRAR